MIRKRATGIALAALMGGAAFAETIEVQMLNVGFEGERMYLNLPSFRPSQVTRTFLAGGTFFNPSQMF